MKSIWRFIKKSLHLLFILIVFALLGFLVDFFMLLAPIFGGCYLSYKKRKLTEAGGVQEYHGKAVFIRAFIVGAFFTAAFIAPIRGCAYILVHLSELELMKKNLFILPFSSMLDGWLGLCGVCFALVAGYISWRQALLIKFQVVNIPTATVRSAAIGIAEFKGVARQVEDPARRQTVKIVSNEMKDFNWEEGDDTSETPIIHYCEDQSSRGKTTEIKSLFYLEDDTGRILVDPRRAESWDGKVSFLTSPTLNFFLRQETEDKIYPVPGAKNFKKTDVHTLRQLYPGDEVYIIGNIEEYENASARDIDHERLILRPSSILSQPDPISRILLGAPKSIKPDMFNIFFLTDILEGDAKDRLTRSTITLWVWVVGWVALSLPPFISNFSAMF